MSLKRAASLFAGIVLTGLLLVSALAAPAAKSVSGLPVVIGFLNQDGGAVAFSDGTAGGRAGRNYVNSKLNGINGRELKFVECLTDGSPESSINCANRFVEAKVTAVVEGVDIGADAALPILTKAHIPLMGYFAIGSAQSLSRNAFFFGPPIHANVAAPLKVAAQRLGIKSLVFVTHDNIVARRSLVPDGLAPAAKHLHVKLKSVFYDPTSPDFTQIVTTALASKPDSIFFSATEPECVTLIKIVRQLHFPGQVLTAGCTSFITVEPKAAEGVYSDEGLWPISGVSGTPKSEIPELKAFIAEMKKDAPKWVTASAAQRSFASTVDAATILRRIKGPITSAAVLKQLRATRNMPGFMGQPITCDGQQWPHQPSACAGGVLEFRVHNGVRQLYSHGFVYARDVVGS
jgi:branched-chain amino acid transport system substrate-binding protein